MKKQYVIFLVVVVLSIAMLVTSVAAFGEVSKGKKTTEDSIEEQVFTVENNEAQATFVNAEQAVPEKSEVLPINTQAEAYHRSLNTIDYFDTASGHVTATFDGDYYDIVYATNMKSEVAYQHFIDNKGNDTEEYFLDSQLVRYNNINKTFVEFLYTPVSKEDAIPIEDSQRLRADGPNGQLCFYYRADPTNITQSCVSLYPQAMAAGLLNDFDLWAIDGKTEYADRTCVIIKGEAPNGNYKGIATFTLYIDEATGVWLYCEGLTSAGEEIFLLETIEFNADQNVEIVFDEEQYCDYKNAREK